MRKSLSFFLDYVVRVLLYSVLILLVWEVAVTVSCWIEARGPEKRIEVFGSFLLSSEVGDDVNEDKKYRDSVSFLENLTRDNTSGLSRVYFLQQALSSSDLNYELEYLFDNYSIGELAVLLNDKEAILALVNVENERLDIIYGNLSRKIGRFLWDFYYIFLFVTAVCLFAECLRWDRSFRFVPYKTWWFYLYLAVVFPAAICVGILIAGSLAVTTLWKRFFLNWKKRKDRRVVRRDHVASYEEVCGQINQRCEKGINDMLELFSHNRLLERRRGLEQKVAELRSQLDKASQTIQKVEAEYFKAKHGQEYLSRLDRGIQEVAKSEFERLRGNPLIKAVEVIGAELHIYTDNLFMTIDVGGNVIGPFRIVLNISWEKPNHLVGVFRAHPTTLGHPKGAGRRDYSLGDINDHCFGNVADLIGSLISEFKINEAIGVILSALQKA